ncbi:MAG: class I SAM-dependent methyltransferase, partial [Flavobacterium sp.]
YLNTKNKRIYDVVARPNSVTDIIPYYHTATGLKVIAKHGYPRPLTTITTDSPVIDGKRYSGYIPEGIAIATDKNIYEELENRFGIVSNVIKASNPALSYYTSPGGINEKVTSVYLELNKIIETNTPLKKGFTGFTDSGHLQEYDAMQLLNTAQTGALVEARLEVNIYNLFLKLDIPLPKWLGQKITIKETENIVVTSFKELSTIHFTDYQETNQSANFLKTSRGNFSEIGINHSSAILEYVYPDKYSSNTLVTIPVYKYQNETYVGLEIRSLPIPQIYSGNSAILTVPALRLPKEIKNFYDLENYIKQIQIGESNIINFSKLGEKYFPSIGITTEQVYPYIVTLETPTDKLYWINIDELFTNIDRIDDAHLLVALCRLKHSLA